MSDKNDPKPANKRRDTLRKLAISGGVLGAAQWSKPVVDSVILPAHAQTSDPLRDPCILNVLPEGGSIYFVQVTGQVLDSNGNGVGGVQVNISVTNGPQSDSDTDTTDNNGNYFADLGPFDACVSGAQDPVATVTSPSFTDVATCTASVGKSCA